MPITASGSVTAANSLTLLDSDSSSTSSIAISYPLTATTRPTSGPPASPAAADLAQIYATKVYKKTLTGIASGSATTISLTALTDLFCNSYTAAKVNTVTFKNLTANPCKVVWDDLTGATGDIIKVPAYGYVQIAAPMDGVTVSASSISLTCATSGQTCDILAIITFQN